MFRRDKLIGGELLMDLPTIELEIQDTFEQRKEMHNTLVIMARTLFVDCLKLSKKHPVSHIGNGDARIIHFKGESNVVIHYCGGCMVLNRDTIELKGQLINLNAPYYYSTNTLTLIIQELSSLQELISNTESNQICQAIGECATIGEQ